MIWICRIFPDMRRYLAGVAALLAVAVVAPAPTAAKTSSEAGDDVTVIAIIDEGINPYHWDYLARKMPTASRLPLDRPPHEWLRGFPRPEAFSRYDSIDLTLDEKMKLTPSGALHEKDSAEWEKVRHSTKQKVNYYWMPGTKIIGAIDFGTDGIYGPGNSHGNQAASVAVGNIHGTCPECLLVFIDQDVQNRAWSDAAIEWAEDQPWIDVISNSYGHSWGVPPDNTSDTEAQRQASDRGQTIFFAAHNGFDGLFFVPNHTLTTSQPGPDWIVTVGAVDPVNHGSYSGQGKPADISSVGRDYPSADGTVGGEDKFAGTSNATPVVAGIYGRALYQARLALEGPSRTQSGGVVARGEPIDCGAARPDCELGDGVLTAAELRARFFKGAIHTEPGMTVGFFGTGTTPAIGEDEFLNEGHGTYFGLLEGGKSWLQEAARVFEPMIGRAKPLKRPEGERDWMIVDSFCRQHLWGSWKYGYYVDGKVRLPGPSHEWPVRSIVEAACPLVPPF